MKRAILLAACAVASVALTACAGTGKIVLQNIKEGCDRDYDGTIAAGLTGMNFTGKVHASCRAIQPKAEAPAVAPASPPGGT